MGRAGLQDRRSGELLHMVRQAAGGTGLGKAVDQVRATEAKLLEHSRWLLLKRPERRADQVHQARPAQPGDGRQLLRLGGLCLRGELDDDLVRLVESGQALPEQQRFLLLGDLPLVLQRLDARQ